MTSPTPTSDAGGAAIEVLSWSGCPSHDDALAQLDRVLTALGRTDASITTRWIETDDEAATARFVGSPSYRIRDAELIPADGEAHYALGCRVYRKRDGRFSPLPDDADLREALEARLGR